MRDIPHVQVKPGDTITLGFEVVVKEPDVAYYSIPRITVRPTCDIRVQGGRRNACQDYDCDAALVYRE